MYAYTLAYASVICISRLLAVFGPLHTTMLKLLQLKRTQEWLCSMHFVSRIVRIPLVIFDNHGLATVVTDTKYLEESKTLNCS